MSVEQAKAILYGLALGDALGKSTEFESLNRIKALYGEDGIQELLDPVLYTDDTQMTLALTEGLLDAGLDADIDSQMNAIGKRFVEWSHSPENNRAPGLTSMKGVRRFDRGLSWRESGVADSKGCGSSMRVATIGYLYQDDADILKQVALNSGIITHGHPTAQAASIGAAYLVKLALDSVPIEQWMAKLIVFTDGISDEFKQAILRVEHVLSWEDEISAMNHIGQGWVGEEAVALALYCVLKYSDDYLACIRRGANSDGDSDSIASIAGGVMGAKLGLDVILEDWRKRCENTHYIGDLAHRMAKARQV
jgi:ADP-ribosylglycohydrolase